MVFGVAMTESRIHYEFIDDHAHAVGYVCVAWAILETELDRMFLDLVPLSQRTPVDKSICESVTGNSNMRDKIKMLKAIGFIRKPSDEWYAEVEKVLDLIDNDFRTTRNRYIHDLWVQEYPKDKYAPEPTVIKRQRGARVVNTQSRTQELSLFKDAPTTADEIWSFANTIRRTGTTLMFLRMVYLGLVPLPKPPDNGPSSREK
jgi:hypothetical protein